MSDDLDVGRAAVVLELEADLVEFHHSLRPGEHPDLWARLAKRLWFKVFQISRETRDAPTVPDELARELAGMNSSRQASIRIVALALTKVSGRPEDLKAEAESLERNVVRFLETPEGRKRKAHIDRYLKGGEVEGPTHEGGSDAAPKG